MSEGNSAVIRRYSLMPVWPKTIFFELSNDPFSEISILEASARQDNAGNADAASNVNDNFDKGVVEFR